MIHNKIQTPANQIVPNVIASSIRNDQQVLESDRFASGELLPDYFQLVQIPDSEWLVTFHLTYRNQTTPKPETQARHFKKALRFVLRKCGVPVKENLAVWFARCELSPGKVLHLHGLLGKKYFGAKPGDPLAAHFDVTPEFKATDVAKLLGDYWSIHHGKALVYPYFPGPEILLYDCKLKPVEKLAIERNDRKALDLPFLKMSRGTLKLLKTIKQGQETPNEEKPNI